MPYIYEYPHPAVTTDVALFSHRDQRLQLLLICRGGDPYRGYWALPGGFVDIDEDLLDCAQRELQEETGVTGVALTQLQTFGKPGRDPRERVISVVYYGLLPDTNIPIKAASDAADARWFGLHELPPLAFDHDRIVAMAHDRVAAQLHSPHLAYPTQV
jgi:8-oxo-dGTP diphosphatase